MAYPNPRGPRDDGTVRNPWCPRCEACGAMPQVQEWIPREGRAVGVKQPGGGNQISRDNGVVIIVKSWGILPETAQTGLQEVTQQEAGENGTWQESGSNSRKEQRP
ncbi:hypothetical protein AAFF_G00216580 [Aldrovandia affinis]|uniref:Uncharacterized protein n=1 Tax=Aldrovandia affinis TaxID=143900 RepID=A0AAD7RG75_9TELE|nr:hypothetical protein AAFF_G00216580 [Aldrovandia affinis]